MIELVKMLFLLDVSPDKRRREKLSKEVKKERKKDLKNIPRDSIFRTFIKACILKY